MPDYRTRRQKLQAMAAQTESPAEAEIAKDLLAKIGPDVASGRKLTREEILAAFEEAASRYDVEMQDLVRATEYFSQQVRRTQKNAKARDGRQQSREGATPRAPRYKDGQKIVPPFRVRP